ncbi:DUF721 domain-containing protein [Candidatus Poribacteria bacterium]|jgi:hypothetical protein|nr:DUF721 domain-containing protein [Candidatus Poribacteria bacterium]MBT5532414.1 DUF721 domain-containing protein [Candidatus Poribacteria bacterium]MBT5711957.1 DUF721 domain-containing protein [Candidatus Poribacteria bacterium]MBT7096421.1 DUF721 domain-containing protein [Candidatus Poribacteria bacterium]MBT7807677.1 DUF721 domain-containing protein [Candidatus Poribacteria bacterium]
MKSTPIGEVLGRYFADRDYDRRRSVESMFDMWDVVIGEPECEMAQPLTIEDGLLTLTAVNATVASEVSFAQATYVQRVNMYFGAEVVHSVRVRVAPAGGRQRGDGVERETVAEGSDEPTFDVSAVSLTADELAWVDEMSAHLSDAETKKRYRSLLLTRLRREKWDAEREAETAAVR